jgi:cytochrome oxidase assembly protein ShyY1
VKRSVITASAFAAIGFAILCSLGMWQLERLAWKEKLIADLNARGSASPVALPAAPEQAADEFRRVRIRLQFAPAEHALAYTPGSALRPDVPGAGYWVMAPAKRERGTIVINRGYVAPGARGNVGAAPAGDVEIVGALRWAEEGTYFTPRDEPANNVWYRRDPVSIAAAKNWGPVAPFYIEQEAPQLPGAPKAGPLVVRLSNNHLQYAITWFGLAAALAAVFLVWLRSRLRGVTPR